ncbi:MAG: NAD-dependent epimerase/dehydratase family protein [Nitrospinaceae bacterium]|jgi:nucleoside-diphosphate-sugar epimerase|nr:MAG: NAD-dependent epimerase/dehydratase family protein [Nitrospinaceae bacterium]
MNETLTIDGATVLVTGATGFIGHHLVQDLVGRGARVHCLVRKSSDASGLKEEGIRLHFGDLAEGPPPREALAGADYLFHCAGLTKAKTRKEYFLANALACRHLYEACGAHARNIKGIIHLSSLASAGPTPNGAPLTEASPCRPITYYGRSKLEGENIARDFASSLPICILRPPVVYGPREKNFFTFLKTIKNGIRLRIGTAPRTLSLIHVEDLVRAMLAAAERPPEAGSVFFVTDGGVYSWDEVSDTAMHHLRVRCRSITLPEGGLALAALVMEALGRLRKEAPLFDRQRVKDIRQSSWTASPEKFFAHYRFQPKFDMQTGLGETLGWYRENRWL